MVSMDARKAYAAIKVTSFHRRIKLKAIEYKGGKCRSCGYDKSASALTFHHRDPNNKDFSISGKIWKWDRIRPELDKCDLLCSNCHHEEHEKLANARYEELLCLARTEVPERLEAEFVDTACSTCGIPLKRLKSEIRYGRAFCSHDCASKKREKVIWPEKEELERMVWARPVTTVAVELGVSGAAVAKRCKRLGIGTPGPGHWNK